MTEYPYMMSNNKISQIIESLQTAAKPPKFSYDFLRNIGYTSTNDRAIIPLLKKLGFFTDEGIPTVHFDQLRDKVVFKKILAVRIRELYTELFFINTKIYEDNDANIKGAISRVTGGDEESVKRVFNTFKTLCNIADFTLSPINEKPVEIPVKEKIPEQLNVQERNVKTGTEFHYNIQIHLPATTDISVYNATLKSLKDNLFMRYKMASLNNSPTIGEVLASEFLKPMNISQNALAKALGIPQNRISDIINGKRGVSADTDLRLCKYFGLTEGYFSGLQMDFERIAAKHKLKKELDKIVPLKKATA